MAVGCNPTSSRTYGAREAPDQELRCAAIKLTTASPATGPLALVRPTTSVILPGLSEVTSPSSLMAVAASAHFKTATSVDESRHARVAGTTRPSGSVR